jgi:hypothetical protein
MGTKKAPTARKVKAASFTALVTAFIVGWILQTFPTMGGLGEALTSFVGAIVTALFALAVGWITKHSPADTEAAAAKHYDPDA